MRARTGSRGSSSSRTTRTSSSTAPTRRARAERPTRPSARPTSPSSRAGLEDLAHGRAAADAARGRGSRPRRDGARRHRRRLPAPGLRVRAARRGLHPGRDEPVERLLRRPARRGHRGPARPRPGHPGRARGAPARGPGHGAGGLVPPRQVLVATAVSFGLAVLCGVYLIAIAGWGLLLIGLASILAGILYTGGPRPYGYEGLGEVFVFLFFGIVAVTGSFYVQAETLPWEAFALAVPVGLLASAILVVNNVRDLETDRRAGKRTLAVRMGRERTRVLYAVMVYGAFLLTPVTWLFGPFQAWLLLPWLALPLAAPLVRTVKTRTDGPALNGALAGAGQLHLAFCVLLSVGLLLS